MNVRQKALTVLSTGLVLMALGAALPGNPRAPFGSGGIPLPFYTGIGAGYVIGGGLAYVASTEPRPPERRRLFRASLLSIPVAFLASMLIRFLERGTVPRGNELLAGYLGLAVLSYPVPFGLVFGMARDQRDRLVVTVVTAILLVSVSLAAVMRPEGLGAAVLFVGFWVITVAGVIFAYPLYRIGLELRTDPTPQ